MEGYIREGILTAVIHIDESYRKKGIEKQALVRVIDLWEKETVHGIQGSWHADEEFSYLEGGMSSNLSIFKSNLTKGHSPE